MRDVILKKKILLFNFFPKAIIVAKKRDTPTAETIKYRWVEIRIDSGNLSQAKINDDINHVNEKNKAVVIR